MFIVVNIKAGVQPETGSILRSPALALIALTYVDVLNCCVLDDLRSGRADGVTDLQYTP